MFADIENFNKLKKLFFENAKNGHAKKFLKIQINVGIAKHVQR